jgi:hypothetical protein
MPKVSGKPRVSASFSGLNLLNDSYLTESFNASRASKRWVDKGEQNAELAFRPMRL